MAETTTYVSVEEVKPILKSAMSDEELVEVIQRVEGRITDLIGAPDATSLTEEFVLDSLSKYLFLRRPISSVTSVTVDDEDLDEEDYLVLGKEGTIQRLPSGAFWRQNVVITVVYAPLVYESLWKQTIIDLIRIVLDTSALDSESIAGEYSYQAGNMSAKERALMNKLTFMSF